LDVTAGIMGVPIFKVVRACLPFLGVLIVSLAILLAFPQISLFLPELMTK
jgi:TRAP-type C4-dicarboxylate transport system permease large subunit